MRNSYTKLIRLHHFMNEALFTPLCFSSTMNTTALVLCRTRMGRIPLWRRSFTYCLYSCAIQGKSGVCIVVNNILRMQTKMYIFSIRWSDYTPTYILSSGEGAGVGTDKGNDGPHTTIQASIGGNNCTYPLRLQTNAITITRTLLRRR